MSNTLKLTDFLTGVGIFKKTVVFRSPITLPPGVPGGPQVKIRVSHVKITDRIPNVFDSRPYGGTFNNTQLRIGNNINGWVVVTLQPGLYLTAEVIGSAVNAAAASLGWWTVPGDPGFTFSTNSVIDKIVIRIDSTKLSILHGTQLWLDLSEATTGTKIWHTLGFASTTSITVDGTYSSSVTPMLDTQGTSCIVCCTVMPTRLVNEKYLQYVADVDFAGKLTPSDNVWPPGNVSNDNIIYSGPRTISQATFYVVTEEGTPMVFMNGRLSIELLFYW
jgi:hypothetical protein